MEIFLENFSNKVNLRKRHYLDNKELMIIPEAVRTSKLFLKPMQ